MRKHIFAAFAVVLGTAVAPTAAEAITVNCNQGKKISSALALGAKDITVVGTCTENLIEIRRDDVTIQGSAGATVVGELFVNAARRVTIRNLRVRGGTPGPEGINGISARDAASVTVMNVLIENVEGNGVFLDRGASAVLDHVTITNAIQGVLATGSSSVAVRNGSVISNNAEVGIWIRLGSVGTVDGSHIHSHANDDALLASRGASLEITDNIIDNNLVGVAAIENSHVILTGNTITAVGEAALHLRSGSTARLRGGGNILTSPQDIFVINMSLGTTLLQDRGHDTVIGSVGMFDSDVARFEDVDIQGDVTVSWHSTLSLNARRPTASISVGNITVLQDSGLGFEGGDQPIQVNGSIECIDFESSVTDPLPDNVTVVVGVACSGFD